jgi:hypothetical protein
MVSYHDTTHVTDPDRVTTVIRLETEAGPADARMRTDSRI